MTQERTLAIVSGGLDSVTMAHALADCGVLHGVLAADYGQRHRKELAFAQECAERLDVPFRQVDLTALTHLIAPNALTADIPVPEGHYSADSMRATVVPARNMILLAVAVSYAVAIDADSVAFGAHTGDHFIYPDCRPEFVRALNRAAQLATCDGFGEVEIYAPMLDIDGTKAAFVTLGHVLGVPFERTWSCYAGGDLHCGRCGTCIERQQAFLHAKVPDPTVYEGGAA